MMVKRAPVVSGENKQINLGGHPFQGRFACQRGASSGQLWRQVQSGFDES